MVKAVKVGKHVLIKDPDSIYNGEWGVVKAVDADGLHYVAIANGCESLPVFVRCQLQETRSIQRLNDEPIR